MLLSDKAVYKAKKQKIIKIRESLIRDLIKEVSYTERKMLREGYSQAKINRVCRNLIRKYDRKFKNQMINENVFSNLFYGAVGHLAPGLVDYLKKKFILYILRKLNIDINSVMGAFFVNALKNVKFLELFGYFKEGKCSLVIETIINAVSDTAIDYVVKELGKSTGKSVSNQLSGNNPPVDPDNSGGEAKVIHALPPPSDPDNSGGEAKVIHALPPPSDPDNGIIDMKLNSSGDYEVVREFFERLKNNSPKLSKSFILEEAANDPSWITQAGDKLIGMGVPEEALKFFDNAGSIGAGVLMQIIQDHIKRYLLPPITKTLSDIICSDLSFEESLKSFTDATKSTTSKEIEKKDTLADLQNKVKDDMIKKRSESK